MKEYATAFYKSQAWKKCAAAYKKRVGGLCERCLKQGRYTPGVIVHHKIYITPENISDPAIALCFDNLELVCRDCHGAEHNKDKPKYKKHKRFIVDEFGKVTPT